MTTKIDQSMAATFTSSIPSSNNSKASKFGTKAGFVIPKNKISGSLILRGSGKMEASDTVKDENSKQVQRKTKWGIDLTQDAAVRRGRALAYQTRVDQIIKQMKPGLFDEISDDKDSQSPKQISADDSDSHENHNKASNLQLLELEKREVIGEILRINPNFKPPSDYKPLLKEAKVPIPASQLKAHVGYNLIGLLGSENNTQKRLEEETGAKIRVYGIKADKAEKQEITHTDTFDAQSSFQEIYVSVSADTYEKIDVAVALIELLITPIPSSADVASTPSTSNENCSAADYSVMAAGTTTSQGVPQSPLIRAYNSPWFSPAPTQPHPGFSVVQPTNAVSFSPSPGGPFAIPQYFGRPPFSGSFPRTFPPVIAGPQAPIQAMPPPNLAGQTGPQPNQQQFPPNQGLLPNQQPPPNQPTSLPNQQPFPYHAGPPQIQPISGGAPLFLSNQALPGALPSSGPPLHVNPQAGSLAPVGPPANSPSVTPVRQPNLLEIPSTSQLAMPPPQRPPMNMTQLAPPPFPAAERLHPGVLPAAPPSVPPNMFNRPPPLSANFAPPASFPSQPIGPTPSLTPAIRPGPISHPHSHPSGPPPPSQAAAPGLGQFAAAAASPVSQIRPPPFPMVPSMPSQTVPYQMAGPMQVPRSTPPSTLMPPAPPQTGQSSSSGSNIGHPILPPQAHLSDFTFQPLKTSIPAQIPATQSSGQSVAQSPSPIPATAQQGPPYFWPPASQNVRTQAPIQQVFRPPAVGQTTPSQAPFPSPQPPILPTFSPSTSGPPSVPPSFSNPSYSLPPGPLGARPGPSSFVPVPQAPNRPVLPPPSNLPQSHRSQLPPVSSHGGLAIANSQFGGSQLGLPTGNALPPLSGAASNQIYDPFSPSTYSSVPKLLISDPAKARKPEEADAEEYEDLMASVGVR